MITSTVVDGEEIQGILDAIEHVLDGKSKHSVLVACLTAVILMQRPDLEVDELREVVFDTSQWICLRLSDVGGVRIGEVIPREKLN